MNSTKSLKIIKNIELKIRELLHQALKENLISLIEKKDKGDIIRELNLMYQKTQRNNYLFNLLKLSKYLKET